MDRAEFTAMLCRAHQRRVTVFDTDPEQAYRNLVCAGETAVGLGR